MNLEQLYAGKSVFVTGHTGFKGSWLTEWLLLLGANVTGYSQPPPSEPALFTQLGLRDRVSHFEGDIRDGDFLRRAMEEARPDFVFHLAAQSLVLLSYLQPRETYDVNAMGTINLLEGLRALVHPCAAVIITTDKCYARKVSADAYREEDALGGDDPYGASKAAAEIAIASYRSAFFSHEDSKIRVASARAGNALGGGDWATDRIVPDCIRSLSHGKSIPVRNRLAIRPWQHVLEPLSGYLKLGAALAQQLESPAAPKGKAARSVTNGGFASAFNFGPSPGSQHSVLELVQEILKHWPGSWHDEVEDNAPHETLYLRLDTDKASRLLGWSPTYNFEQTVKTVVDWYRESASFASEDLERFVAITRRQIADYAAASGE